MRASSSAVEWPRPDTASTSARPGSSTSSTSARDATRHRTRAPRWRICCVGCTTATGPGRFSPPFCCGHGWTMMPLETMLTFVSEQVYTVRHYAGSHPQGPPEGRIGFSWQPTNNFSLPAAEWDAAKRAIAARIGAAIQYAYRQGGASAEGACSPPDSGQDWCDGADVPGAAFTDAWQTFENWN